MLKLFCNALLVSAISVVSPVMLAQEHDGRSDAPLVAQVLDTEIHTTDPEEMKSLILDRLLDRYAIEQGIVVSQADIDAYIDAMARVVEQDRQLRAAQRNELLRQLDKTTPEDAVRDELVSRIETLDMLQSSLDEMDSGTAEDVTVREQVASAFIRQWKLNRALYQQHGGRVIYQQGGPEPLDAYRAFLEERHRQGAFNILDKSLDSEFWRYYTVDSIHTFYPAGSPEEMQAFDEPWWLSENPTQSW